MKHRYQRRGSICRHASVSAGFTLLEMLIAFAIASIGLAVLYRGATDGLLGARLAERNIEAVARARSRLAAVCHGARLMPGGSRATMVAGSPGGPRFAAPSQPRSRGNHPMSRGRSHESICSRFVWRLPGQAPSGRTKSRSRRAACPLARRIGHDPAAIGCP